MTCVVSIVVLAVLAGCGSGDSNREHWGGATIKFDGYVVGSGYGGSSYPRVTCRRESDVGPPTLITRDERWCCGPDVTTDWVAGGEKTDLRLEFTPTGERPAVVRFTIGESVYASGPDTSMKVEPGWAKGRAVFTSLPLVEGEPFKDKRAVDRFVVEWECLDPRHGG